MSTSGGAPPGGLSINGTMPGWAARAEGNPLLDFVDFCLRGVGQVCFMNNPVTGLAILVAMVVAEPWLGFAGALGLVASNLAAILIGMDRGAIRAGLFGFNGVLVGAGLSLFLQPDWAPR
jgi:urea transporter